MNQVTDLARLGFAFGFLVGLALLPFGLWMLFRSSDVPRHRRYGAIALLSVSVVLMALPGFDISPTH